MNIGIIVSFFIVSLSVFFISYKFRIIPQILIFILFGIGIGPLLQNLNIEYSIYGLRVESWIWLSILSLLFIGILESNKLNKVTFLLANTSFKFYFVYLIILFLGILRAPNLPDGIGLFLISLFPIVGTFHYFSNKFNFDLLFKFLFFSLTTNILVLIVYLFMGFEVVQRDYTNTIRLTGSMGWSSMAYFLLVFLSVIIVIYRGNRKKYMLFLSIVTTLLIFGTISRAALLIVFFLIIVNILTLKKNKFIISGFVLFLIILISPFFYDLFYYRFFYIDSPVGFSTSGRSTAIIHLYSNYINDFFTIIFGKGSGFARSSLEDLNYLGIKRVHSTIAESFFDTGLLGTLFLLLFVIKSLYSSFFRLIKFKINFFYKNILSNNLIKHLLLELMGSTFFLILIFLDNIYDPFLTTILFYFILSGEVSYLRYKNNLKKLSYKNIINETKNYSNSH